MTCASYWAALEPYFERVDIYSGTGAFLRDFKKLAEPIGHLLAGHWCQSEASNGGLIQFFGNPTGVLAPEAKAGFVAVGADDLAEALGSSMRFFGARYLRDHDSRIEKLCAIVDSKGFKLACDSFIEAYGNGSNWERVANAYAKSAVTE